MSRYVLEMKHFLTSVANAHLRSGLSWVQSDELDGVLTDPRGRRGLKDEEFAH